MFDTFIALFGGLFLAGKKIGKKLSQVNEEAKKNEFSPSIISYATRICNTIR